MNKLTGMFAALVLMANLIYAQAPDMFNYQAVARNSNGTIIPNQAIGIRFTIHDGSPSGTNVYQETQTQTTNSLGLFTAAIGGGTVVTGTIASVNWSSGSKYLEVEIDPTGGTTYTITGTSQLLSVPYALSSGQWGANGNNIYNLNSGYVGIGQASPQYPLDVLSSNFVVGEFTNSGGTDAQLRFGTTSGAIGQVGYAAFDSAMTISTFGSNDILFGSANLVTVLMALKGATGQVGVGTLSPVHGFDIYQEDLAIGNYNVAGIWLRGTATDSFLIQQGSQYTQFSIGSGGQGFDFDATNNYLEPWHNAVTSLGDASFLWSAVYASNGTIQTSDVRMKKNIHDLNLGLNEIMQLRPVSYEWKNGEGGDNIGFIAQEVEQVLPQAVVHDHISDAQIARAKAAHKDVPQIQDPYGMKYSEIIPVLTKAIQEQQQMITKLQKEVEALKAK